MSGACKACGKKLDPSLTVDAGVMRLSQDKKEWEVLLIQRGKEPFEGCYAFPGGFVDYDENPEKAVLRELEEECNLHGKNPSLVAVGGSPKRDPRKHIVSILYHVTVADFKDMKAGDDAATAKFYLVKDFLEGRKQLAFDHLDLLKKLVDWNSQNADKAHN